MREKKANVVPMASKHTQQEAGSGIPFGRPAKMGNFRLWKSSIVVGKGKAKVNVECINVSDLEGTWLVRIPQTYEMFGMLTVAYQWSQSDDMDARRRGEGFIRTAISNMFYVSNVCNCFFHHGIEMVAAAYANPSLLRDGEDGQRFIKDAKETIEHFLAWREEYENHAKENEPTDQEMRQDEIAEEALKILSDGDGKE
jgi:hypothetical protein